MDNQINILIIEDDNIFRDTLLKILKKEGYHAEGASDSAQALDLAKKKSFDILVSDVRLPGGIDGIETVRKIKETLKNNKTISIIMTGYADMEAPIRAIKVKVDDYIKKPFELKDFIAVINDNAKILLKFKSDRKKIEEKIKTLIAKQFKVEEKELNPDSDLVKDFKADIIETVGLIMAIEDEFKINIGDNEAEKMTKIKDFVDYIQETISV